jgi:hypothetical protein
MRRRVLTSSFSVHLLSLAAALGPSLVIAHALTAQSGRLGADTMSRADVVTLFATGPRAGVGTSLAALAIAAGAWALLATPIQMAWLETLAGGGARASLRAAWRRTLPALGASALVLAILLPALVTALALPVGAHVLGRLFGWAPSPAVTLALSAPALALLLAGGLTHLLARVKVAEAARTPREAVAFGLRAAPRAVPRVASYLLASTALGALALWLSVLGEAGVVASLTPLAAHALLFGRTALRGALYASLIEGSVARRTA